jgi:hypothetical protein
LERRLHPRSFLGKTKKSGARLGLAAVLSCHRDHVAFVDSEVAGGPEWTVSAARASEVVDPGSLRKPIARAVPTPFDRLPRFINRHRKRGFIDLRAPGLTRQRFRLKLLALQTKNASLLGYVAAGEYWIPGPVFERVAGGASEALALKKELFRRGLLMTDHRGSGFSYVVKRPLPDGTRPNFVVIRHTRNQAPALGQALLTAPLQ